MARAHGQVLRAEGFEGALINAPTGSGKSSAIAVPNLLEWQGSMLCNDFKSELYELTYVYREKALENDVYQFAPSEPNFKTHGYNPFYYVSDNPNLRVRDLQIIAEIIIPLGRGEAEFWAHCSRDILIMLAIYLLEIKGMATFAKIHDLSKQKDFIKWLKFETESKNVQEPLFYQNAYSLLQADEERTQKNILKDFHARMSLFADSLVRHATSKNDFDLRQLRRKKMSIYISIPDGDKERLKPILTLFWVQAIAVLTEKVPDIKEEPYPVLALLDEFGNMARMDKLKDGMSFLRGYRILPIIIVQYLSQLTAIYGREGAEAFLNTKIKMAFTLNSYHDAEFFSKSLGTKTVRVRSRGFHYGREQSSSHNENFQPRSLMTPDEILKMKNTKAIILLEGHPPIKAKKLYWFKVAQYRRRLANLKKANSSIVKLKENENESS